MERVSLGVREKETEGESHSRSDHDELSLCASVFHGGDRLEGDWGGSKLLSEKGTPISGTEGKRSVYRDRLL